MLAAADVAAELCPLRPRAARLDLARHPAEVAREGLDLPRA
jgi:hypothetical protein